MELRVEDLRKREDSLSIVVAFPGPPGFSGVRIHREVSKAPGARKVEVGDELFDSTFSVEGPARLLSVLLDAETRRLLVSVNTLGRLAISGGALRVEIFDEHLKDILPLLFDLTRRLAEEISVAERLAENARQDPEAGVRLRNLLVLAREFSGEPGTTEALRAACSDPSPRIRLRAAMALGLRPGDPLPPPEQKTAR
jgi:hypothetical protein